MFVQAPFAWPVVALTLLPLVIANARRAPWVATVSAFFAVCGTSFDLLFGEYARWVEGTLGPMVALVLVFASSLCVLCAAVMYWIED